MVRMKLKGLRVILGALALVGFGQMAKAQSTLMNIPSTDVVSPKKAYLEFDYFLQTSVPDGAGRQQWYAPRIVVGAAPKLEVGANFFNAHVGDSPAGPSATFSWFQPNVKYRFWANDDAGVATSVGIIGYTPINHREGVDSYGLVYGNLSKKIKSTYGTRLTAGPYGILGAKDSWVGTRAGAIVGLEQPLSSKVTFVADWFSGVSGFGYFTPAVSFALPHNSLFNIGYSIGNDSYKDPGNDNRLLYMYYGITFP